MFTERSKGRDGQLNSNNNLCQHRPILPASECCKGAIKHFSDDCRIDRVGTKTCTDFLPSGPMPVLVGQGRLALGCAGGGRG